MMEQTDMTALLARMDAMEQTQQEILAALRALAPNGCMGSNGRKSKMEAFRDFARMVKENELEDVIDIEAAFHSGSWESLLD